MVLATILAAGVFFYARWRFDQIHKAKVADLAPRPTQPAAPFDVLLVGSDSRAFVDNSAQAGQFGSASSVGGQRSDVIIIARIAPAIHQVKLLSIPRDTYVDIPGTSDIAGPNRINAAFDNGPTLLVQTIENSFHIPISDYAEVNFPGFQGMVDALGGITLNFRYLVKDSYSGLNIDHTGCQTIHGIQALGLVRSRHLEYFENGEWLYDGNSDWSRIQRQDAFFRALISKMRGLASSPLGLNSFLGAASKNLTIDQTLSESVLIHLANVFRGFRSSQFTTETLPTIPYTTSGGAAVLLPAQSPDEQTIGAFLAFGTTKTTAAIRHLQPLGAARVQLLASTTPTTSNASTVTTVPHDSTANTPVVYNNETEPWNPTPCSS